ncbi:MAG: AMP-binding protein [Ilumatobacter sp.]|uniref:AMP-dependent synthetase/ligase n=1 Tax=Ilumatobacter sp. TaxID=1967498 RepID=UPI0026318EA1|nr:AMP-binding protein [Ilumatobacter sp.]MDJ0768186.1 AMP-binding protein [Ilumatobacter sp.]
MTLTEQSTSGARATSGATTVASLAKAWADRAPKQVAMREKDFGIWREYDWGTTWDLIEQAAHGLLALGVEPGDRVAIHAEDRPEWVILDLATVAVRGITVGFYPTNPAAEVEYLLGDCGATVHFAEDEEQYDKVDEIGREKLPNLRHIIFVEPRGMVGKDDERLVFWDNFLEMGREHRAANPTAVADRMAAAEDGDVMTLVYTSGTTGPPKGAMLTNKNSAFCIDKIVNADERVPGKGPNPKDQIVTYLPLCHVAERIFSTWTMVGAGPVLNFAESIETVNENLREVQPTIFFAVPRIWEKLHAVALIKANDASFFKKQMLRLGLGLAARIGKIKVANDGNHTIASRILAAIGWLLVFRALRERIGLRRCRYASSGAAAIAPEVLEFFIGLGVPVFELYGMTENSAIATANFVGRMKLGTVGEPYPGIGFRIDEATGEIQTKHDGVFKGYWNKPDKTAETFTDDGWLMTGDVAEWVDGTHVRIVDRIKHIIITSGGKNISPSEIENSLKTSPYVNEAMVIGEGRKYLTALIGIELETVADWALRKNLPYTTYRDLTEKPEVIELIDQVVQQTNEKFARVENVRKFALLPKELDHEDGELTATQKLKRSSMLEAYGDLVESMY